MNQDEYKVVLPPSAKGAKELKVLYKRRKNQVDKAISKLRIHPTDITKKGIEKLEDNKVGEYSIRVSKGDRLIYDVNQAKHEVLLIRAVKHDFVDRLLK